MGTKIGTILRAAKRKQGRLLNILTFPTHERYETNLCRTGHNFYAFRTAGIKDWNTTYGPLPANYSLLPVDKDPPLDLDFDIVLSQNKFGQYRYAKHFSEVYGCPLISLEHTLPVPTWNKYDLDKLRSMVGDINVFISDYSVDRWGFQEVANTSVLTHGVDTELFRPIAKDEARSNYLLSVVNDWRNRDWCMPAGQHILTTRGYIPIEKVVVGMEVITDDGIPHPITKTLSRDYFGDMVIVKLSRDIEVRFTPSHAVRVLRHGQWAYIESSRLRSGDQLRFPLHQQTDFTFQGVDEAWLIGLIVGDGSITDAGTISICFHEQERENAQQAQTILSKWVSHSVISERHRNRGKQAISVDATSKIFGNWLKKHIGGKAGEKRLPDFIMRSSIPVRLAALRGLWTADGSFKNGDSISPRACYSTISPCLAGQVSELLHSFGVKCSISRVKRTTNKSSGKEVPIYRIVSYGQENVERCYKVIHEATWQEVSLSSYNYIIQSVDLEPEWAGKVYNCEVADNPSYIVYPGFIVHNCCGFKLWQEISQGLPTKVVGATPGLSKAPASVADLVNEYQAAAIFLNTSLISPVPMALLEAMACGCAIVSTANCMIPEILKHAVNGLISNDPKELRSFCIELLKDKEWRQELGAAARQTIVEKFNLEQFVQNWNTLLEDTVSK